MVIKKETALVETDGVDQLGNAIGFVKENDFVRINYKGYYIAGGTNKNKQVKYQDTWRAGNDAQGRQIQFKVPKLSHSKSEDDMMKPIMGTSISGAMNLGIVVVGIQKCVHQMMLGEETRFTISSDDGYGQEAKREFCGTIPSNSDLVVDVAIMAVARDGTWHVRQKPKDTSCCLVKLLSNFQ